MNYHQTIEEILATSTPEQKIIWNYLFLRYGERISIRQFYYSGSTAGTDINVYSANKIYFAYKILASCNAVAQSAITSFVSLYDDANNMDLTFGNNPAFWDTTAAAFKVIVQQTQVENVIFSRLAVAMHNFVKVTGYQIGI